MENYDVQTQVAESQVVEKKVRKSTYVKKIRPILTDEEKKLKNKEACRVWREINKDKVKEYSKSWYDKNKEKHIEKVKSCKRAKDEKTKNQES
jgi:hypothetical protein